MIREQLIRYLGVVLGIVVAVGILVVVVPVMTGRPVRLSPLLAVVTAVALVAALGAATLALWIGRRIVGDHIEVALREPGGTWRHGRLTVTPHHLSFQPYRWQVRIPVGAPEELAVEDLGPDTGRRPPLRQIWRLNPQLHIVTLHASGRTLELAALPSRIPDLRKRLALAER